jgi:hypothetical protein
MSKVTIVLTSGTTWTVPIDCTSATVEVIGGYDSFFLTGGGYSRTNNVTLTPLQKVYIQITYPQSGLYTWFNKDNNSAPTSTANGASASTSLASAIGDIKYSGGTAGSFIIYGSAGGCCSYNYTYGGAGGTAGPNGNGANGGDATAVGNGTLGGGGGGGAANGGTVGGNANSSTYFGGSGGNSFFGTGGVGNTSTISATSGTNGAGGGGSYVTSFATPGTASNGSMTYLWTDTYSKISYGVSGGPGGSINTSQGSNIWNGGSYAVNPGVNPTFGFIIVTYTPVAPAIGTYVEAITSNTQTGWKVPPGVSSLQIECIGAGGTGNNSYGFSTPYPANTAGSGGDYAINTISVSPNDILKIQVGVTQLYSSGVQTSSSPGSTVVKSSNGTVLVCASGAAGGLRGSGSVGSLTYAGGLAGNNAYSSTATYNAGGGGGGAAGPGGAGKAGGNANTTATSGRAGGGGGAGGTSSTAGGNASAAVAGAGGAGPTGTAGGSAGTSSVNPGNGSTGSGGGGGFSSATATRYAGGNGGTYGYWTLSGVGQTSIGPGGGGGGAGETTTSSGTAGAGGGYGGGGGGGGAGVGYGGGGVGAGGLIILTYTVSTASNASSPEMTPMFFR